MSPVGRTRTAPAAGNSRFRFAFASCQQYEQGYFAAYRDMATRDLDLVVHLGDYIYEKLMGLTVTCASTASESRRPLPNTATATHSTKLDADLQAAHAAFPWLATWDDHEVAGRLCQRPLVHDARSRTRS